MKRSLNCCAIEVAQRLLTPEPQPELAYFVPTVSRVVYSCSSVGMNMCMFMFMCMCVYLQCGSSRRTVNQLQLTSWPDKGVPTQESGAFDPDVLLRLVRTVRDLQPQPPPQLHPSSASAHHLVPILVHCRCVCLTPASHACAYALSRLLPMR